jgi:hypothetical protein
MKFFCLHLFTQKLQIFPQRLSFFNENFLLLILIDKIIGTQVCYVMSLIGLFYGSLEEVNLRHINN